MKETPDNDRAGTRQSEEDNDDIKDGVTAKREADAIASYNKDERSPPPPHSEAESSGLALSFMFPSSTIPNPKQWGQVRVSGWTCQSTSHTNTQGRVNKGSQKR